MNGLKDSVEMEHTVFTLYEQQTDTVRLKPNIENRNHQINYNIYI